MVKRKLASHDNLKITVEQTGDKFHLKEVSTFRTVEIDFTLGVTFNYSMADGTELTVSTTISDLRGIFSLYNLKNKGSVLAWLHEEPLTHSEPKGKGSDVQRKICNFHNTLYSSLLNKQSLTGQ